MIPQAERQRPAVGVVDDRLQPKGALAEAYRQAQFMVGFIYSEEKKDYDQAEAAFRALLAKYPNSELAVSANWMLEHMRSEKVPEFDPNQPGFLPVERDSVPATPR